MERRAFIDLVGGVAVWPLAGAARLGTPNLWVLDRGPTAQCLPHRSALRSDKLAAFHAVIPWLSQLSAG